MASMEVSDVSEPRRPERPQATQVWAQTGRYMGFGLTWALSVLLFFGAGWWLDTKLGTAPWLALGGAFLGGAAGFYHLYYHVVVEPKRQEKEKGQ
jgi:ATP synthase protein I